MTEKRAELVLQLQLDPKPGEAREADANQARPPSDADEAGVDPLLRSAIHAAVLRAQQGAQQGAHGSCAASSSEPSSAHLLQPLYGPVWHEPTTFDLEQMHRLHVVAGQHIGGTH